MAAIPPDYDRDPERFRTARSVLRRHALAPDVHGRVAGRISAERLWPVLDVGCGEGELAPAAVGELFAGVEVERWDAPLLLLPSRAAVRDYLVGKGVDRARAEAAAATVEVPLSVTKRGALVFARSRG